MPSPEANADACFVLDASAIIELKNPEHVPWDRQWRLLRCLEEMVEQRRVAFPQMVLAELKRVKHLDAPGVWALGVFESQSPDFEPSDGLIAEVRSHVPEVVDPEAEEDDADPAVIAQALHLRNRGKHPIVVTKDASTGQNRMALTEACARMDPPVATMDIDEFIIASECLASNGGERPATLPLWRS